MQQLTQDRTGLTEEAETYFALSDVYFTRTNDHGDIEAADEIFRRLTEQSWDELIGAPHSLTRHPDVPDGVIWMSRELVRQGKTTALYVKNRTQSGAYFWALSIMTPCGDGALMVRIKPTSHLLGTAREIYAAVRAAERAGDLSPREGAEVLVEELAKHGFGSYEKFIGMSVSTEYAKRQSLLEQDADPNQRHYEGIIEGSKSLRREVDELDRSFSAISTITYNMRIIASRLEPAGGPLTTISENYQLMSNEFQEWLRDYTQNINTTDPQLRGAVRASQLTYFSASLLEETAAMLLENPPGYASANLDREHRQLIRSAKDNRRRAGSDVRDIVDSMATVHRISGGVNDMKRLLTGLRSTTVLCKTEAERLSTPHESLSEIVHQLRQFQQSITDRISNIQSAAKGIVGHAKSLAKLGNDTGPPSASSIADAAAIGRTDRRAQTDLVQAMRR